MFQCHRTRLIKLSNICQGAHREHVVKTDSSGKATVEPSNKRDGREKFSNGGTIRKLSSIPTEKDPNIFYGRSNNIIFNVGKCCPKFISIFSILIAGKKNLSFVDIKNESKQNFEKTSKDLVAMGQISAKSGLATARSSQYPRGIY